MEHSIKLNKKIKCVIWDLDNTLWNGILLEDNDLMIRDGVIDIIKTLDSRGILQSIASKNNHDLAVEKLREFRVNEYFLYPKINWNSKSSSVKEIAQTINIGMDSIAFIDDQQFELDEVEFAHPDVLCINADQMYSILDMEEFIPTFITEDSKIRRMMYIEDIERKRDEENYEGPQEEFLASLGMVFTISAIEKGDLERAEELTMRTHQLNTTGYTYSYAELDQLRFSDEHKLLIAGLDDKYGTYGKIGIALIKCDAEIWTIKLLLMSCRVMSRGVGAVMLNHIMSMAKTAGKRLRAEFISNDRNKMMYITYKFAGFTQVDKDGDMTIFENNLNNIQPFPEYIKVNIDY